MRTKVNKTYGLIILLPFIVTKLCLGSPNDTLSKRKLCEASLTVLKNENRLIPLKRLDSLKIASITIGSTKNTPFNKMAKKYTRIKEFLINIDENPLKLAELKDNLKQYNCVLLNINKEYEAKQTINNEKQLLENLKGKTIITSIFANPHTLNELSELKKSTALIIAYENNNIAQELTAQLIFGAIGAKGKLPVSINDFQKNTGLKTIGDIRLKHTIPEEVGINSVKINHHVDSIVNEGIKAHAFPGCRVFVAYQGKVIFNKSYGFHTYDSIIPVKNSDLYDLASITKVAAPLPILMKLYETGKINLDKPFSNYWHDWKKRFLHPSNKSDFTFREILAHQAGLKPGLNFWKQTVSKGNLSSKWYRNAYSEKFPLMIDSNLYLKKSFRKRIYKAILKSSVTERGKYKYSGLSFFIYPQMIENITGENYEKYLKTNFYTPLGAWDLMYNPDLKQNIRRIVPTEFDSIFRKKQVLGRVHDESAAIMGGISGNAGLFGTADDLAKLIQMYIRGGTYGGITYLKKSTVEEFSKLQFQGNRRGLGFDKPLLGNNQLSLDKAYPAPLADPESFGHSGFTGTFFWADPQNELLYIFLSNRVYPTRKNRAIYNLNIRPAIQQFFYEQINQQK